MNLFQRFILLILGLALACGSLPYLIHEELHYSGASQSQIIWNITLGLGIALYNVLAIYKIATTVHVVIDSEIIRNKIEEKKGEDNYV